MLILLLLLALLGQFAAWVFFINRLHAAPIPRGAIKICELTASIVWIGLPYLLLLLIFLNDAEWFFLPVSAIFDGESASRMWEGPMRWPAMIVAAYALPCLAIAVLGVPWHLWRQLTARASNRVRLKRLEVLDISRLLGHRPVAGKAVPLAAWIPGNEILKLAIDEKTLFLPRLPLELEGFSITHVSDLHFTGGFTPPFFEEVVRRTLSLNADLIAITGDIIDERRCLPWIEQLLSPLHAPHGVYAILGNHDLRVRDERSVRAALAAAGTIDVGRRAIALQVRGYPVWLAGNELPWFPPAGDFNELRAAADRPEDAPFRIALAHSPDQMPWGRRHEVDLLLAGHAHGGQVRLPLIGPLVAPCSHGVKYAGTDVYYEEPTLMHVSRGISGTRPLRWNCLPELTKLVLRRGE